MTSIKKENIDRFIRKTIYWLARIAVNNGVSKTELYKIIDSELQGAAKEKLERDREKVNLTTISKLSGVNRNNINMNAILADKNFEQHVFNHWISVHGTKKKAITIDQFHELVSYQNKRLKQFYDPDAVIMTLRDDNVITVIDDKYLELVNKGYYPDNPNEQARLAANNLSKLFSTIDNNFLRYGKYREKEHYLTSRDIVVPKRFSKYLRAVIQTHLGNFDRLLGEAIRHELNLLKSMDKERVKVSDYEEPIVPLIVKGDNGFEEEKCTIGAVFCYYDDKGNSNVFEKAKD